MVMRTTQSLESKGSYCKGTSFFRCYKLFENALTFFAASDACHEDGATLASIYNASENTYIASKFSR